MRRSFLMVRNILNLLMNRLNRLLSLTKINRQGRWLLLFLILLLSGSVLANDSIVVPRILNNFDFKSEVSAWNKKVGGRQYSFTSPTGVGVQVYAVYDAMNLYLGFFVTDQHLNFDDDYSKEFIGSDHLKVYIEADRTGKEDLALYLLPTSKIREPLLKISGLSWHRNAFKLHSKTESKSYFVAVSISLKEIGLFALPGETIKINCLVNNVTNTGTVEKSWLVGQEAADKITLVFQ